MLEHLSLELADSDEQKHLHCLAHQSNCETVQSLVLYLYSHEKGPTYHARQTVGLDLQPTTHHVRQGPSHPILPNHTHNHSLTPHTQDREAVFPTRQSLGAMKSKLKGAQTGHDLLKRKSEALTKRFREITKRIDEAKRKMGRVMQIAAFSLAEVTYAVGNSQIGYQITESVKAARFRVRTRQENVSGVFLPQFESWQKEDVGDDFKMTGLGKGGQQVQRCRETYTRAVETLVELASLQTAFVILDEVIKVVNRRVNAMYVDMKTSQNGDGARTNMITASTSSSPERKTRSSTSTLNWTSWTEKSSSGSRRSRVSRRRRRRTKRLRGRRRLLSGETAIRRMRRASRRMFWATREMRM